MYEFMINSDLSNKLSLSGGTLNGTLYVGGKVELWTDNEGGNINIMTPNNHHWQMDAHDNNTFRLYHHDGSNITGYHTWADGNYCSSGDVTTSSGVSLNGVYNNFANYLPLSGGVLYRENATGTLAINSNLGESSIYLQQNGTNKWAIGKGVGGIGDDYGLWSFDTSSVAFRVSKDGNATTRGALNIGDCIWMGSNNEGGNIRLTSADRLHHWEIDGCSNADLRIYRGTHNGHPNGAVEYDQAFYFCMDGNLKSDKKGFVVFRGETVNYSTGTGQLVNASANFMLSTSSAGHLKTYTHSTGADLDNAITLGTSSARFKQLFAGTTSIATSDRNYKDNITPLSDIYKEFFMKLIPVSFTFKDGESGRTHIGFISQDVESTMEELGMSSLDFAGFCKDKKVSSRIVEKTITDEEGNETKTYEEESTPVLDKDGNPEYIYSLRYSEFIGIISHVLQDTVKRLDSLEERLAKLGV